MLKREGVVEDERKGGAREERMVNMCVCGGVKKKGGVVWCTCVWEDGAGLLAAGGERKEGVVMGGWVSGWGSGSGGCFRGGAADNIPRPPARLCAPRNYLF